MRNPLLGSLVAAIAAVSLLAAEPARAEPPWAEPDGQYRGGPGLQACLAEAKAQRPQTWTCLGGQLTTVNTGPDGTTTVKRKMIEPSFTRSFTTRKKLLSQDYDTWCENGDICGRQISQSIAEVKGNGAYGNSSGAIGAFDQVLRQNFDGAKPTWRALLIHDGGPTVIPTDFRVDCRVNQTGPDGYCGQNVVYFSNISASSRRTWYPSSTGVFYNAEKLKGSTKYHDDFYGQFNASGYGGVVWYTGVLHTGRWQYCGSSTGCKYYQVPWQP